MKLRLVFATKLRNKIIQIETKKIRKYHVIIWVILASWNCSFADWVTSLDVNAKESECEWGGKGQVIDRNDFNL